MENGEYFRVLLVKNRPKNKQEFETLLKLWNEKASVEAFIDNKVKQVITRPASVASNISKERFEICKTCDKSGENGHKCSLHKGCCFGRWRARPENKCPADPPKWDSKPRKIKS